MKERKREMCEGHYSEENQQHYTFSHGLGYIQRACFFFFNNPVSWLGHVVG